MPGSSNAEPAALDQADDESVSGDPIPESAAAITQALMRGAASSSSNLPATGPCSTDSSGMPLFDTPADLPFPNESWSPEAMLTWMYNRCLRRLGTCETEERKALYQQRLVVLRQVMQSCRSGGPETRFAASQMTRSMQDLSDDEESPLHQMSYIQVVNEMDAAEQAFHIGSAIADTVSAGSSNDHVGESRHADAVATNLMRMLDEDDENQEEESDSDDWMETESHRRQRYLNSELCECSDPDEWMAYHHGSDPVSDFDGS